MRSELLADDTEQFIEKIMEDFLSYRDNFEIYIQTMISQALDPSFFSEITREKGEKQRDTMIMQWLNNWFLFQMITFWGACEL